eukprot:SAG25_NODE_6408_length_562_cov_1.203024_1_plen_165_part_10
MAAATQQAGPAIRRDRVCAAVGARARVTLPAPPGQDNNYYCDDDCCTAACCLQLLLHAGHMPDLALLRRLAEQHGVPAADVDGAMGRPHPRTALLELLESATTPDQATNVDNYTEMRASSNPLALAPPDVAMEHCLIFRSGAAAIDVGVDILGGSDDSSSNSGGD